MGFPFVSIWAEIKGRIELCCANFWFLLHFALPQSGKYRCGSSVTPVQVLPVVYLGDRSVQLPGMYRRREGLWKPPLWDVCVSQSLAGNYTFLEVWVPGQVFKTSPWTSSLGGFLADLVGLVGWIWSEQEKCRISGRKSCQGFCQSGRVVFERVLALFKLRVPHGGGRI